MRLRVRPPDITFVAAVALVAIVQIHYWDLEWKFGGLRSSETMFLHMARALINLSGACASALDVGEYRYAEALTNFLAISIFTIPAFAILLVGRIRFPKQTMFALRIAAVLYVAWLLVLSPKVGLTLC